MLEELKQRLREISDLNAAGVSLNWDQATYMLEGGAGARSRQPRCSVVWRTSGRLMLRLAALSPNDAILIDIRSHPTHSVLQYSTSRSASFQIALSVALKHDRDHPTD